jgi:hypothetical protein
MGPVSESRAGGPARTALGLGEAGHCRRRRGRARLAQGQDAAVTAGQGQREAMAPASGGRTRAEGPMGRHWHGPSQGSLRLNPASREQHRAGDRDPPCQRATVPSAP